MADVVDGRISVDAIREIEIEDLLGRESAAPDPQLLSQCVTGKVVLVSGAGGSIGSELCRQPGRSSAASSFSCARCGWS